MTTPQNILKELGLLPQWRLLSAADQTPAAEDATTTTATKAATIPAAKVATPAAAKVATTPTAVKVETAAAPVAIMPADIARMDWTMLYQTVRSCVKCRLCQKRKNAAFGIGDTEADIMLVGEGPGAEEDRQGEPFVGPAGKLLDKMLAAIGLSRESGVYIANIVKCRPPQNRVPKSDEAAECLPYLHRQIALVKPKLLVALGRVAAAHLVADAPIAQMRQSMHDYRGIPVVVSYHPAYLLRNPADKRKSWDDLRMIKQIASS